MGVGSPGPSIALTCSMSRVGCIKKVIRQVNNSFRGVSLVTGYLLGLTLRETRLKIEAGC